MIKRILQLVLITCLPTIVFGQNSAKKILGHEELVTWKRMNNTQISNDGNYVTYELKGEEGDGVLQIYNARKDIANIIQTNQSKNQFCQF